MSRPSANAPTSICTPGCATTGRFDQVQALF
ncbi:MAG: gallidermin family protein [Bacteroidetes bacterium]|nr:MAG: gallidermin family protein [Bacteroidota bacterium]